jgi:predicted ABC-type ATPase
MSDHKVYTIFAGVNGAGKSTFYRLLNHDFGIRVNVDEIVRDRFGHDWKNPATQTAASRIAVTMIKECLRGDASFNQEATLTGRMILSNIKTAKANGFKISLFYVGLENVNLSVERVAARAQLGGHSIPEDILRRRYTRSFENLKLVLPLCDSVQVYDNSGSSEFDILTPLLVVKDRKVGLWDENCPHYLKDVLKDYIDRLSQ